MLKVCKSQPLLISWPELSVFLRRLVGANANQSPKTPRFYSKHTSFDDAVFLRVDVPL